MAQARRRGVGDWQLLDGARPTDPIPRGFVRTLWFDFFTWIFAVMGEGVLAASAHSRTPSVDLGRGLLRCGFRTITLAAIDRARVGALEQSDGELGIRLLGERIDVFVPLRDRGRPALQVATREVLLGALPQTSIRMPVDRYDPAGKFSRYNFPGYLTLEQTIAAIDDPVRAREIFDATN